MSTKMTKAVLLVTAVMLMVVAFIRFNRATVPDEPVPVVWDREVCSHCKMHVGDPRFAAQLQTTKGEVHNFDDPGCLLEYLQSHGLSVHALYFRNHEQDGWLSETEVGFLPADDSPMGYGIRAVPRETPEARDIAWAKREVAGKPHHPQGGS